VHWDGLERHYPVEDVNHGVEINESSLMSEVPTIPYIAPAPAECAIATMRFPCIRGDRTNAAIAAAHSYAAGGRN
jgi:hypothetical protein